MFVLKLTSDQKDSFEHQRKYTWTTLPGELPEGAGSARLAVGLLQLAADSEMDPFIEDGRPRVFVVVTGRGSTTGDTVGPDRFAVVCILTCAIAYYCNKQIIERALGILNVKWQ